MFAQTDRAPPAASHDFGSVDDAKPGKAAFGSAVVDFYLTNPISRASAVMAECSALAGRRLQQAAE